MRSKVDYFLIAVGLALAIVTSINIYRIASNIELLRLTIEHMPEPTVSERLIPSANYIWNGDRQTWDRMRQPKE